MTTTYPLTLLYDGHCPVCSLEIEHLRSRDALGRLVLVDIAAADFDAARWRTTHEALDAAIHGYTADGKLLLGPAALRAAYAAVGLGWVAAPTGWAPLRPLFDAGYRVFARHRRRISAAAKPLIDALRDRRARRTAERMAACHAGTCDSDGRRP